MRTHTGPSVLVIDEFRYLPIDATSAWGAVFADGVVAGAILDRLLHHATVANIRGQSDRMRAHVPSRGEDAAMLG